MKTKLYIISAIILAALGIALFSSSPANAAPMCGDTDFVGPCLPNVPVCDDKGFIGPCAPVDYANVDCNSLKSYEAPHRCTAVKHCINDRSIAQATCVADWKTCRDKVADAQGKMKSTDREACFNLISTGSATTAPPAPGDENPKSSCAIDGIGWIICPVMRVMSAIVDGAYNMISSLLTTPAVDTSPNSDMYKAWATMRNFANVAFVIAFLIIIFSQLTSIGITNYGIKKMLPRIIIAAILVNLSYWICAFAVDISNILGSSSKGLLEGVGNQLYSPATQDQTGNNMWGDLTAGLIAGGLTAAALYVGLSALLPMLIMAIFAVVTVVLILTLRQALIIILIVTSPLAFVAYLLPNTESVFNKWRSVFLVLLLMFPIIGLIFGGSALAAIIITNSAGDNFVLQVMAAGITVIPLFITPIVMKVSGKVIGGVASRLGGFVNNPNKGLIDRSKRLRERQEQRRGIRALSGGAVLGQSRFKRSARKNAIKGGLESGIKTAQAGYVASEAMGETSFRNQLAGGSRMIDATEEATNKALANAINIKAAIEADEVKAANAIIEHANLSSGDQQEIALGGAAIGSDGNTYSGTSTALRAAAIQNKMKTGTLGEAEEIIKSSGNINTGNSEADTKLRQAIAEGVHAGGHTGKATYLGGDMSDRIKAGQIKGDADLDDAAARRINKGKLAPEDLANQDADSLKRLSEVAAKASKGQKFTLEPKDATGQIIPGKTEIKLENLVDISAQATNIINDNQLNRKITGEKRPYIDALNNLGGGPTGP